MTLSLILQQNKKQKDVMRVVFSSVSFIFVIQNTTADVNSQQEQKNTSENTIKA